MSFLGLLLLGIILGPMQATGNNATIHREFDLHVTLEGAMLNMGRASELEFSPKY